ncbi:MAG: hypothetical protein WCJ18_08870, partial [Planctomycetota bacterium]
IGDSVLNGGSLTDDADTATGVLNALDVDIQDRPVSFMNLSAGSWAPPQQLAYLKAYGTLDANLVVLVLSSHDALGPMADDKPPYPTVKPWLATEELLMRYVLGFRRHIFADDNRGWEATAAQVPAAVQRQNNPTAVASWCLDEIVTLCASKGIPVGAVLWPTMLEATRGTWDATVDPIVAVLDKRGVLSLDLLASSKDCIDRGCLIYRDGIHATEAGQKLLAGAILELTLKLAMPD